MLSRRSFLCCTALLLQSEKAVAMPSQTATRFYKTGVQKLDPVSVPATIQWAPKLIFQPGFSAYNAPVYDMTQPGLYCFSHYRTQAEPWANRTHMVVYDGDAVALLSAAAWLSAFGDADNGLSKAQMSAKARTGILQVLCGPLHQWAKAEFLDASGIQSRMVYFLTMEEPDGICDGHQALEVKLDGSRVLVDLSNNAIMTDAGGSRLSANSAVSAIAANDFGYETLAADGYAIEGTGDGFDATVYAATNLATEGDRRTWHRRIFQAIGIDNGPEIWWKLPPGADGRAAWVESLQSNYRVKSPTIWNAFFYP